MPIRVLCLSAPDWRGARCVNSSRSVYALHRPHGSLICGFDWFLPGKCLEQTDMAEIRSPSI
jgi:hypothetical protein